MDFEPESSTRRPHWFVWLAAGGFLAGLLLGYRAASPGREPSILATPTPRQVTDVPAVDFPPDLPLPVSPTPENPRVIPMTVATVPTILPRGSTPPVQAQANPNPQSLTERLFLPVQMQIPGPARPEIRRVLIISIDGLRPDAIIQNGEPTRYAPTLASLARRGSASWSAQTVIPPATLPGHASMLSGYDVDGHGVRVFSYEELKAENEYIQVPTIFDIANAQGYRTVIVAGKNKLDFLVRPGAVDDLFLFTGRRLYMDDRVATKARRFMEGGFGLMLVHLPDVDYMGTDFGWMSREYLMAVRRADRAVGDILKRLESLNLAKASLVIITADHGGRDFSHTANLPENRTIPWIVAGPQVIQGQTLTFPVIHTMDTAATALWALGLEIPADLDGRPVLEAFRLSVSVQATPALP